ncbi:MAG: hypothetical protein AAGI45_01885 [Cyanobacteria bacterium P01_H01_bin.26]
MATLKQQLRLYRDLIQTESNQSSQRFIIFGRGRSGSTALVSLLNCLPKVYCDGEILEQRVLWPQSYVRAKAHTVQACATVYGCKILSYQLRDIQHITQGSNFLHQLNVAGFQIIYLRRENLLDHAISNIRARSFGFHQGRTAHTWRQMKVYANPSTVVDWINKSHDLWDYETSLLRGLPHLALTYEKDLADEAQHQSTINAICRYLSIQSKPVLSHYQKVSPQSLQASVANYDELVDYLKYTPYYHYLPLETVCR